MFCALHPRIFSVLMVVCLLQSCFSGVESPRTCGCSLLCFLGNSSTRNNRDSSPQPPVLPWLFHPHPPASLLFLLQSREPMLCRMTDNSETGGLEKPVLSDPAWPLHMSILLLWSLFLTLSNWQPLLPMASAWFVNKTSLEHVHAPSFVSSLWLLSQRDCIAWLIKLKLQLFRLSYQKKKNC